MTAALDYPPVRFLFWEGRKARVLALVLIIVVFCGYALHFAAPPIFSGDAENYWSLGKTFFEEGHFSLWNYDPNLRGYLWPFVLGVIQVASEAVSLNPFKIFFLLNSIFSAFAVCVILPGLVVHFGGRPPRAWQILLFAGLFFAFWRGFLTYPLTDTVSFFLLATGMWIGFRGLSAASPGRTLTHVAGAGLALGAASNLRPIYLIVPLIFLVAIALHRSLRSRRKAAMICVAALAIGLCHLPQSLLNQRYLGTLSPTAHSQDLYRVQLFFGILLQRHECAYFIDGAGEKMLQSVGIEALKPAADGSYVYAMPFDRTSYDLYVSLLLHHPLDFVVMYLRHFLNGIAIFSSHIYLCRPTQPETATMFASAGILLAALTIMLLCLPGIRMLRHPIFLLALIAPPLLTIPTGMEGRFLLPLHLAAYALILFVAPIAEVRRYLAQYWRTGLAIWCMFAMIELAQMSNLLASIYFYQGPGPDGVIIRPGVVLLNHN